jgi:hypothetical protein
MILDDISYQETAGDSEVSRAKNTWDMHHVFLVVIFLKTISKC